MSEKLLATLSPERATFTTLNFHNLLLEVYRHLLDVCKCFLSQEDVKETEKENFRSIFILCKLCNYVDCSFAVRTKSQRRFYCSVLDCCCFVRARWLCVQHNLVYAAREMLTTGMHATRGGREYTVKKRALSSS